MVNTDTTYYTITDQTSTANWEVGLGTWGTGNILTRTTILKSSNANAAVNFTSGALYVFMTYPADKAVYEDANNRVSGYVIDNSSIGSVTPSTGAFTTLSASSTVSGTGFSTYLASPPAIGGTTANAGTFTNLKSSGVTQFSQLLSTPRFPVGQTSGYISAFSTGFSSGASAPTEMDLDPENRTLYLADAGGLRSYSISSSGALTFLNTATSGTGSYIDVKAHPQGNYVYGANSTQIIRCTVNTTTGALTFSATAATLSAGIAGLAITPNGNFLYAIQSSTVYPYSVNLSTGALTAGTTSGAASARTKITIDPTGQWLFTGGTTGTQLIAYSIDQTTGNLTAAGGVVGIDTKDFYCEPSGRWLYTLNGNNLYQHSINPSTGALAFVRFAAELATTITGDAAGFFLYVTSGSDGSIKVYSINQSTGEASLLTTVTNSLGVNTYPIITNKNSRFLYFINPNTANFNSYYCDTLAAAIDLTSAPPIGSTSANTGAFTTLSASSTVSGTGFSTYLASPPAIGGTTAAAGTFTTVTATASTTGSSATGAFNYGTLGYSDQNTLASFQSSVNTYNQVVVQNTSSGTSASADLTISNNLGTATTYYANFGINSSTFSGTGSLALPNATYVATAGGATASDLVLGTFSSTAPGAIRFVINGSGTDALNINTSSRTFVGGSTSATALLHVAAGTASASTAPVKFTSGTNLTTPEAGTVEYDGTVFYQTNDATSGRGYAPTVQFFRLAADGSSFGPAIGNFFGPNSALNLAASSVYEIEVVCYFTKSTAGTVSFTLQTSAASFTYGQGILYTGAAAGGNSTGAAQQIRSTTVGANTVGFGGTVSFATTASHALRALIIVETGNAGNIRVNFTQSAGTLVPNRDSYYKVTRLPAGNSGIFVA
jgi:6-phosphogluconolactonase (cycloisomerase 2 family)